MKNTLLILTEDISYPIDEGIKKFSILFIRFLNKTQKTIVLARNKPEYFESFNLPQNKLFLSLKLKIYISNINPSSIIYIPFSSTTVFSFIRLFVLSFYSWGSKETIISLQRRNHNYLEKIIIKIIKPDLLFTFSNSEKEYYESLSIKTVLSGIGVDATKYIPVDRITKFALRNKYGFSSSDKIALHVGHINRDRNVKNLINLATHGYKILIVGSTSTTADELLITELEEQGCIVYNHFIKCIEEIYQIADLYIFPVISETSAIEFPLSVLEAMSCNLPVFSTKFGALPDFLSEIENVKFFESKNEMISKIKAYNFSSPCSNRKIVLESFTWDKVFNQILIETEAL